MLNPPEQPRPPLEVKLEVKPLAKQILRETRTLLEPAQAQMKCLKPGAARHSASVEMPSNIRRWSSGRCHHKAGKA
ncbi:MAG: hypothetical protein WAN65_03415 [Candidatus Sulfotelmatobacter sp.]